MSASRLTRRSRPLSRDEEGRITNGTTPPQATLAVTRVTQRPRRSLCLCVIFICQHVSHLPSARG
jgi:hypothetical protein